MDTTYLVEIRLGRTKWRINQEITSIAGCFGLSEHREKHPHVTIFGPLFLNPKTTEEEFLAVLGKISSRYNPIPFLLDGWEKREGMHGSVIAFSIRPSGPLIALTQDIAEALLPLSESLNAWDPWPEKKWYHVTIANHLDPAIAQAAFSGLERKSAHRPGLIRHCSALLQGIMRKALFRKTAEVRPILLDETGLRLTVMKGEDILTEYDFSRKEWLPTGHTHSGDSWKNTLRAYRLAAGFECSTSDQQMEDAEIFVISDLHLGHANIIRYCSRPFLYSAINEMDAVLIRNWNTVISPAARAFHLGDLRYGKDARPARYYAEQLRGNITFIAGNHDDFELTTEKSAVIDYEGFRFLLIHDPADAPPAFDGWVIHGHHHNNDLRTFPFLDPVGRRINVSAEVIGYVPISLREICSRIQKQQATGTTGPVLLRYPYVS